MKKNTFIILSCLATFIIISLTAYRFNNKTLDLASQHVASINLDHFQFRGAMQIPKQVKPKADKQEALLKSHNLILAIDPLFEKKPLEALARYLQLLESDPGQLGLRIRLGMLQLKLQQNDAAKENLYFVYEHKEAGLQPDAAWFLALLSIKENNLDKAKLFLKESIDLRSSFLEEAQVLLATF